MKQFKVLTICFCLVLGLFQVVHASTPNRYPPGSGDYPAKTGPFRWDRVIHFQFGCMTSISAVLWTQRYSGIEEDYGLFSIGIPFVIGYCKEIYDHKSANPFKWTGDGRWDMLSFVVGGVFGKFLTYSF